MFTIWRVDKFDRIGMTPVSVAASSHSLPVTGQCLPLQAPMQFSGPPRHGQWADPLLEPITHWRHLIRENANRPIAAGG